MNRLLTLSFLLTFWATGASAKPCDNYKSSSPRFQPEMSSLCPHTAREPVKKYTQFQVTCARNSGALATCASNAVYKLSLKTGCASVNDLSTFSGTQSFCADRCLSEGATFRSQLASGGCP